MRFSFANWLCDRLTEDADFGKKSINLNQHSIQERNIRFVKHFDCKPNLIIALNLIFRSSANDVKKGKVK